MYKVSGEFSCRTVDEVTYRASGHVLIEFQRSPDPHAVKVVVQNDRARSLNTRRILANQGDTISVLEGLVEIRGSEVRAGTANSEMRSYDNGSRDNPPLIFAPIVFVWRILSGIVRALLGRPKPQRRDIKVTVRIPHNTPIREIG